MANSTEWDIIRDAKEATEMLHMDDPQGPASDLIMGFDTEKLDRWAFALHATATMIDQEINRRAAAVPVDRS